MKVLYLTTVPTPYKVAFFEELGKLCDLTVLFENKQVSYREKTWMVNDFHNFTAIFLRGFNIKDKKISVEAIRIIKNGIFDHIIIGCYSTITQMIAQKYMIDHKISFIHSSDGGMIKEDSALQKKLKSYFIKNASAWLGTGKVTTEYLEYYGACKNRIITYPFTSIYDRDILLVPDSMVVKRQFRNQLKMYEDKIVLSVGQLIYRKGIDILIKAASKLNNIGIYIIGGTPSDEYVELKRKYNANNIHFISFKEKYELSKYYRAADVFVLPTREDIWGLVINEAMSYGIPVITTNKCVAGMEMIEQGVTGSIVEVENVDQLVEAVRYWLENGSIESSKVSLEKARQYTIEKMATVHYEILRKM